MPLDFQQTIDEVRALCTGETDEIALMATISCHLYQQIEGFDWVGFYRVVDKNIQDIFINNSVKPYPIKALYLLI